MYAGYGIVACKRYISEPHLELGLKALAVTTPMIVTAYQNYRPQNQQVIVSQITLREEIVDLANPIRNYPSTSI